MKTLQEPSMPTTPPTSENQPPSCSPSRPSGRPPRFDAGKKRLFCDLLREGATRRLASQACGVTRQTVQFAAARDADFAQACRQAMRDRLAAALERYAPWRNVSTPTTNDPNTTDEAAAAAWKARDRTLMRRWENRLLRKLRRRFPRGAPGLGRPKRGVTEDQFRMMMLKGLQNALGANAPKTEPVTANETTAPAGQKRNRITNVVKMTKKTNK
jgi:hypothetical protein